MKLNEKVFLNTFIHIIIQLTCVKQSYHKLNNKTETIQQHLK